MPTMAKASCYDKQLRIARSAPTAQHRQGDEDVQQRQSRQLGAESPPPGGTHCVLELYDCPAMRLNDAAGILQSLREAAHQAQAQLLREVCHQFQPQGVTAFVLLAESHIAIHTWPAQGYAAVDVFTCSPNTQPERACAYLVDVLEAGRHGLRVIPRPLPRDRPSSVISPRR